MEKNFEWPIDRCKGIKVWAWFHGYISQAPDKRRLDNVLYLADSEVKSDMARSVASKMSIHGGSPMKYENFYVITLFAGVFYIILSQSCFG